MKQLWLTAKLDMVESLRARWFPDLHLVFGGIVALLFVFGLTRSRVLGFIGLSRLLVTTSSSPWPSCPSSCSSPPSARWPGTRRRGIRIPPVAAGVPGAWFWGKILGRYVVVFAPVFLAMLAAVTWATFREIEVPWSMFGYYTALLAAMAACFLGIGMLLSSLARSTDMAQGAAFLVWLVFPALLDLILLGVMIQGKVAPEVAILLALANPLQVFRTAALALFDPQLSSSGLGLRHPRSLRGGRLQALRPRLPRPSGPGLRRPGVASSSAAATCLDPLAALRLPAGLCRRLGRRRTPVLGAALRRQPLGYGDKPAALERYRGQPWWSISGPAGAVPAARKSRN